MQSFAAVLKGLQVETMIRGFATSVSNYQPFGAPCSSGAFSIDGEGHVTLNCAGDACCDDPCNVLSGKNPANNEYNYAQALSMVVTQSMPSFSPKFVIDTGRSGRPGARADCGSWCNPEGMGAGHLPTGHTDNTDLVDAALWIKPPGESDGCEPSPVQCTEPSTPIVCKHPDHACIDPGHPCGPAAGDWYDYGAKMLAENANFNGAKDTGTHPLVSSPFQPCGGRPCARGYTCGGIGLCVPTAATLSTFKGNAVVRARRRLRDRDGRGVSELSKSCE